MNPLHLPLTALPGPVPVGAPVLYGGEDWTVLATHGREVLIARPTPPEASEEVEARWVCASGVALDLTAPPTDAQGHPTRIDGADVAVGILARAMGHHNHPDGVGGAGFGGCYPGGWFVCNDDFAFFHAPGVQGLDGAIIVPALANIDPQHPDAARLALAAVIRFKPWGK